MLYILDTDHISLLQRQNATVTHRLKQLPLDQRAVTAVTLAEQLQGRLTAFRRGKTEAEAGRALGLLLQTVEFYRTLQILPYDHFAIAEFARLRRRKIRIGTQDLRIAAIALCNGAIIVTRNIRDFGQVPSVTVVDWSLPL